MAKDIIESKVDVEITEPEQGELFPDNPYTKGFRVKTRGKRVAIGGDHLSVMNMETGELNGTAEITQRFEIDSEKFIKVFQLQIAAFFGLTSAGTKVLTAIWAETSREPGKDLVYMSEAAARRHAESLGAKMGKATYFRGRSNLIEMGFIAPSTDQNRYWINPAIFFNGDRVKFITEMSTAPQIMPPEGEGKS